MIDPVESLVLDMLEWIGPVARPQSEVMEAWRTSCPRLPVWEEANVRGYLTRSHVAGEEARIAVSDLGRHALEASAPR